MSVPAVRETTSSTVAKAIAGASLLSAGVLFAVQQAPALQRISYLLAGAATLVPLGLFGWTVGGGALALTTRGAVRDVAVASVLGCGMVHAAGLTNRFGGRRTAAGESRLRVTMLNVEYGQADTASLMRRAEADDADVVVIIEYHPRTEFALADLAREYPYRVGRATADAEGALVLSRTPLAHRAYVGAVYDNHVVSTTVRGVDWTIAAVHPYPPVTTAAEWVEDSRRVADMIRPFTGDNLVVIGDFNATIDQVTMGEFTSLGLSNAALQTGAGWQTTWPMKYLPAFAALDHALISPTVVANSLDTFAVPGTDHKGLSLVASVR